MIRYRKYIKITSYGKVRVYIKFKSWNDKIGYKKEEDMIEDHEVMGRVTKVKAGEYKINENGAEYRMVEY